MTTSPEKTAAAIDIVANQFIGVCMPESVERGQIVDVMLKYLEEIPATRHEPTRSLLSLALMDAYPCE